ncbi:NHL repeat protein [Novipirellula galeiformis]|uniref:NHL repeat protein n=1 Tax=Novipirellula galeiformis TaxID=2528004 RepID=A0A5C6C0X2_9BACT|nr:peptidyl-alpha-hydroxyglycine alpha-amidating lyase family protein [Novipirellula galeiformis]TWU17762.1 NHL repeat protein [Novipirellula galeiformis]
MTRHLPLLACAVALCTTTTFSDPSHAAEPDKGKSPDYPRVNVAPWYRVDPTWPQKPDDFIWEAVPAVAVDKHDHVYVFTRSKPPIQVYTTDGKLVRSWGDDTIETAHHLKIDDEGNIWVADIGLHVIRKFSPEGKVLLTIGTPGVSGEDNTHLDKPTDMAIAANGDVFVSDGYGNNRVVHYDGKGNFVKAWGSLGTGPEQFSLPHAMAIDSAGRLYVADRNNARVMIYDQQGTLLDSWDNVIVPWGFCVTAEDHIWVCGASPMQWRNDPDYPGAPLSCPPKDQVLMKFNTKGKVLQLWTIPKGEDGKEQPGDVNWLHGLALDSHGNIYVGDIIGKRAQKLVLQK